MRFFHLLPVFPQNGFGKCGISIGGLAGELTEFFGIILVGIFAPTFEGFIGHGVFGIEGNGGAGADTKALALFVNSRRGCFPVILLEE